MLTPAGREVIFSPSMKSKELFMPDRHEFGEITEGHGWSLLEIEREEKRIIPCFWH